MKYVSINDIDIGQVNLKILVADDTSANLGLLEAVLTGAGHTVIGVRSGEEAILSYQAERPDLVLMDVMMPGIGGVEATRRIRALDPDHWVPIIYISALSHRDDMVHGLEAGGDDYLSKPIDVVLLLAKINAMQRISVLEEKLRVSNIELNAYRKNSERELDMARELMEQMVSCSSTKLAGVELWLKAAANLGGDLLVTQQFGEDIEYVMHADAMGHGLSAAFPLVPLVQVFRAMTRKGMTVSEIIQEMNRCLSNLLPSGNFVAVTLVSLDRSNQQLDIWNGGNPPVLLSDSAGKVTHQFKSRNVFLGILRKDDFESATESFQWADECTVTLYSDGLVDAVDASGVEFGEAGILSALQHDNPHQSLKDAILVHLDAQVAEDDISLATINLRS